jgi:hypothetical protein
MRQAVMIVVVVAYAVIAANGQQKNARQLPTQFDVETPIASPIIIPKQVAEIINSSGGLEGTSINLDNQGQPELLVRGDAGANITGFWIFQNVRGQWKLLLSTRAYSLSIDKTWTNGYRDISVRAMSAVKAWGATHNYDLEKYTPRECFEQDLVESGRGKIVYHKCPGSPEKP